MDGKKIAAIVLIVAGIVFAADGILAFEGHSFLPLPKAESSQLQYSLVDFIIAAVLVMVGLKLREA